MLALAVCYFMHSLLLCINFVEKKNEGMEAEMSAHKSPICVGIICCELVKLSAIQLILFTPKILGVRIRSVCLAHIS